MYKSFLALCAVAATFFATSGRADAGIRLTLSQPGESNLVFFAAGNALGTGPIAYGDYSVLLDTVLTSWPNSPSLATLTSTVNFGTVDGVGIARTLTILAQVVDDANIGLAPFTNGPAGPPFMVTNNLTGTSAGVTSGMLDMTTFLNGTPFSLNGVSLPGLTENSNAGIVNTPPAQFTLENQLVLSGLNFGIQPGGAGVTGTSSIRAVPAPAGVLLLASAAPVLVAGAWFRRRKTQAPTA